MAPSRKRQATVRYFPRPEHYWEGHEFPMKKLKLLKRRIDTEYNQPAPSSEREQRSPTASVVFLEPEEVPEGGSETVLRAGHIKSLIAKYHSHMFLDRLKWYTNHSKSEDQEAQEWSLAEFGVVLTPEILANEYRDVAGTLASFKDALCKPLMSDGVNSSAAFPACGFNIGGGNHHAFPDHGEGFCIVNDIAVSLKHLFEEKLIRTALVLDADVHQGNGVAYFFRNCPEVVTVSWHQKNNYPWPDAESKEVYKGYPECFDADVWNNVKSDLDIELEDGIGDDIYLHKLEEGLRWLEKNRNFAIVSQQDPPTMKLLPLPVQAALKKNLLK